MTIRKRMLILIGAFTLLLLVGNLAFGQQMAMTEKQLLELFSTKAPLPIPATYKGEQVKIEYRKLEDHHKDWFKVLYIFYKPGSDEEWFFYQIHQETLPQAGEVSGKVFSRIFQISKNGPAVMKGYAGTSAQESFEVLRKFLEAKFRLVLPADTKL